MSKVLIIKPSSLGDIIHGLQVAESIRRQMPQAHITWIAAQEYANLVRACSGIEWVFEFERRGGIRGFGRLIQRVRRERFDWIIDMQGLARSGLMAGLARGSKKIGRSDAREGAKFAYDLRAPLPQSKHPHAIEILLELLPLMGLEAKLCGSLQFNLPQPPIRLPVNYHEACLLFPESRRPEKVWHGFAELAARWVSDFPDRVFVWCGSRAIRDQAPRADNLLNVAGETELNDIIWLIQHGGRVVANDSGPLHIAAALGKPVLALFGPTNPASYGPYPLNKPTHCVIRAPEGVLDRLTVEAVHQCDFL